MVNPTDLAEKGLESQMAGLFVVGLVVSFTAGLAMTGNSPMAESSQTDSTDWEGVYTVKVVRDGEVVYKEKEHNLLTNQGQNWIRSQISANDGKGMNDSQEAQFISVGNKSAPQSGDTVLPGEITSAGLERTEGTTNIYADGEFEVKNTFTANIGGDGSIVVNTTGLNWNGTADDQTLISGGSFSDANLLDGDQLTVTHNVTIS